MVKTALLTHCLTSYFFNFLTDIGEEKNTFKKSFEMNSRAF